MSEKRPIIDALYDGITQQEGHTSATAGNGYHKPFPATVQ